MDHTDTTLKFSKSIKYDKKKNTYYYIINLIDQRNATEI